MDPAVAEREFRERVAKLGGTVLEPTWLGKDYPHRARCAVGHDCSPRPSSLRGGSGMCLACVGNDPAMAEREFRARVAKLGGTILEPTWLGANTPHRVRCMAGHECTPRPTTVQQGAGFCRVCSNKVWDVFYVVIDDGRQRVKFGITSGDPSGRLRAHARSGYNHLVRLLVDIPGDAAPELERAVLAALRTAGEVPIQGREHFDAAVSAQVLKIVDRYATQHSLTQQVPPAHEPRIAKNE